MASRHEANAVARLVGIVSLGVAAWGLYGWAFGLAAFGGVVFLDCWLVNLLNRFPERP